MASSFMGFVSDVAGNVASRVPMPRSGDRFQPCDTESRRCQRNVPRSLDLNYVTERIVAMAQPAEAANPTRVDKGRDDVTEPSRRDSPSCGPDQNDTLEDARKTAPLHKDDDHSQPLQQPATREPPQNPSRRSGNSVATLSTFVSRRHSNKFLAVNLSDQDADDRTLLLLNRQVIRFPWLSPCIDKSETPSLSQLLDICYALHAYLSLDSDRVVLVYCANGKTRTGIAVACYLKFCGIVNDALDGFCLFCSHRCPEINPKTICEQIPPSLKTFFRNFDDCIELGDFYNPKPLLLRAVALQGVPVDDQPLIDIWDSQQNRVYSSHPELWNDPKTDEEKTDQQMVSSQWADEEGFYRVNKLLAGDFVLLCRFGGPYADDSADPSKILFRYANNSGFLTSGPYELPKGRVDMMRRYESSFDEEDFLLTLMFDSSLDSVASNEFPELCQRCRASVVPEIHEKQRALDRGFAIIAERHAAQAASSDVDTVKKELGDCSHALVSLALQLSNHDIAASRSLLNAEMKHMWMTDNKGDLTLLYQSELSAEDSEERDLNFTGVPELSDEDATANILEILNGVELDVDIEWIDRVEGGLIGDWDSRMHEGVGDPDLTGTQEPDIMYNPIVTPNRGDIVGSFHKTRFSSNAEHNDLDLFRFPPRFSSRPRLPTFAGRKRQRPCADEENSPHGKQKRHNGQKSTETSLWSRDEPATTRRSGNRGLSFDIDTASAMDMLLSLSHTGVSLPDLISLQEVSRTWTGDVTPVVADESGKEIARIDAADPAASDDKPTTADAAAIHVLKRQKETLPGIQESSDGTRKTPMPVKSGGVIESSNAASDGRPSLADSAAMDVLKRQQNPLPGLEVISSSGDVPLKDNPDYAKYFKMLKMGLPNDAAKHAMKRDAKDPKILDLDPEKSLDSQTKQSSAKDDECPLREDPEYVKYFKMLKMGLPEGAVRNALQRDGKDPSIMDLDPNKSLKSQKEGGNKDNEKQQSNAKEGDCPLREDPEYVKYFKMLSMGLPEGAVRNALQRDGKDPSIMDLDPSKSLKSQKEGGESENVDDGPPLKDDPEYTKYFKMLKMGLPEGAVKQALQRDGKDPSVMDLDHNRSLKRQKKSDDGPPLKDDPAYSKYFKMLKMGLPAGAVKNALQRDGKDTSIIDLDPNKSAASQLNPGSRRKLSKKEKKAVRRKKIYWTPIDPVKVHGESIWSLVQGTVIMDQLKYDMKEFESLFTESMNPADKKKKAKSSSGKASKQKKSVQVIDGKRGMNGGIILARLKIQYEKLADMVDKMQSDKFDSTQLRALKEFLPTDEERAALDQYLKNAGKSEESMVAAKAALSECEKYMVAMMKVSNADAKFDCMLFKTQFDCRLDELLAGRNTVKSACDEVRASERLRKMMAMILTLVNQINTGGSGKLAVGFSLDALLKLNEAKAFDKKTSVLHYLAKLVLENDKTLTCFHEDLPSVGAAENVILDSLATDIKSLNDELERVHSTAEKEADKSEGKESEQKEEAQVNSSKSDEKEDKELLPARTPMESFCRRAEKAVHDAVTSVEDLKVNYSKVLEYFGEDENMASCDFFGTLNKFIAEFKKAAEQVEKEEKRRLKEKLRAAAKAAMLASRLSSKETNGIGKQVRGKKSKGTSLIESTSLMSKQKSQSKAITNAPGVSKNGKLQKNDEISLVAAGKAKEDLAADDTGAAVMKTSKGERSAESSFQIADVATAAKDETNSRRLLQASGSSSGNGATAQKTETAAAKAPPIVNAESGERAFEIEATSDTTDTVRCTGDVVPVESGAGIAAMAAAAAKYRANAKAGSIEAGSGIANTKVEPATTKSRANPSPDSSATSVSGIAAMAAAAAKARPALSPAAAESGSGIAAMAAAAARSRSNSNRGAAEPGSEIVDAAVEAAPEALSNPNPVPEESRSAIATSAAEAFKSGSNPNAVSGEEPVSAETGSGISDMAAAAARSRSSSNHRAATAGSGIAGNADGPASGARSDHTAGLAESGLGIAAMAAAAAVARAHSKPNPLSSEPGSGVAAAETGARSRHSQASPEVGSGIAALAAAAAKARNAVSGEELARIGTKETKRKKMDDSGIPVDNSSQQTMIPIANESDGSENDTVDDPRDDTVTIDPTSRSGEAVAAARSALAMTRTEETSSANSSGMTRDRCNEATAASTLAGPVERVLTSSDAAAVANAGRREEAAGVAAEAALLSTAVSTGSSVDAAALAAAARHDEAMAAASAALAGSGDSYAGSSRDLAAEAAENRKQEAAAAVKEALAASRAERRSLHEAKAATTKKNDAAATIAAALAASRREREVARTASATSSKQEEPITAVAAAVVAPLKSQRGSRQSSNVVPSQASTSTDGNESVQGDFSSILGSGDDTERDWSKENCNDLIAHTSDLIELAKARMHQTEKILTSESESDQKRVWLKPSDVKASAAGTASRIDATSLLWDTDDSHQITNDISAILWDKDEQLVTEKNKDESTGSNAQHNEVKQWFRDGMSHDLEDN